MESLPPPRCAATSSTPTQRSSGPTQSLLRQLCARKSIIADESRHPHALAVKGLLGRMVDGRSRRELDSDHSRGSDSPGPTGGSRNPRSGQLAARSRVVQGRHPVACGSRAIRQRRTDPVRDAAMPTARCAFQGRLELTRRSQAVNATVLANTSHGFIQPSVCRGRELNSRATAYRRQIVEHVRSGRTPGELAREFQCSAQTIRNWVHQADRDWR